MKKLLYSLLLLLFLGFLLISIANNSLQNAYKFHEENKRNSYYRLEAYENQQAIVETTFFPPPDFDSVHIYLAKNALAPNSPIPKDKNFPFTFWQEVNNSWINGSALDKKLSMQTRTLSNPESLQEIIFDFNVKADKNFTNESTILNQEMSKYSYQLSHLPTQTLQDFPAADVEKWLNQNLNNLRDNDLRYLSVGNYNYTIFAKIEVSGYIFKTYEIRKFIYISFRHENLIEKTEKTTFPMPNPQF